MFLKRMDVYQDWTKVGFVKSASPLENIRHQVLMVVKISNLSFNPYVRIEFQRGYRDDLEFGYYIIEHCISDEYGETWSVFHTLQRYPEDEIHFYTIDEFFEKMRYFLDDNQLKDLKGLVCKL